MLNCRAYWSCRHDDPVFLEVNSEIFSVVRCQGHGKVDSVTDLNAELSEAFLDISNCEFAVV